MRRLRDMLIFLVATGGAAVPAAVPVIAAGGMLLASPDAALASPQAVIRDCARDGKLDHHYSLSDLKNAEKTLPTDVDEYTNCRDVINQAEVAGSGGNSGGRPHGGVSGPGGGNGGKGGSGRNGVSGGNGRGGGSGSGGPSAADLRALDRATHAGSAPSVSLQGQKVVPGSGGLLKTAATANHLPVPALLSLIAVAALTAAGGFVALGRRYPGVIGAALRIFRR
jgi:hypothetical protein